MVITILDALCPAMPWKRCYYAKPSRSHSSHSHSTRTQTQLIPVLLCKNKKLHDVLSSLESSYYHHFTCRILLLLWNGGGKTRKLGEGKDGEEERWKNSKLNRICFYKNLLCSSYSLPTILLLLLMAKTKTKTELVEKRRRSEWVKWARERVSPRERK